MTTAVPPVDAGPEEGNTADRLTEEGKRDNINATRGLLRLPIISLVFALSFVLLSQWTGAVTLSDAQGRKVILASRPARIVSLAPSVTEILFAIGAGDRVVGVTSLCDFPKEARSRTKVGDKSINYEVLLSLKPDLVAGESSMLGASLRRLEELKIPVVTIDSQNLAGFFRGLAILGKAVYAEKQSRELSFSLEKEMASFRKKAKQKGTHPRVFVEIWNQPLMTAGRNTLVNDLVEIAGGENIGGKQVSGFTRISAERVIASDPEVIVLTCRNLGEVLRRPGWSHLSALRNRRVYEIDPSLLVRPSPRMVEGVRALAKWFHP